MTNLDSLVIELQPERPVQYFKDEDLEDGKK